MVTAHRTTGPRMPPDPVGPRGRIGLLALATDVNSETDLRRMLPEGTDLFTNRIENANPVTIENLRAMAPDVTRAARGILPGNRIDVLVYSCTSGTIAIGEDRLDALIHAARPGVPWTNPVRATLAALTTLEARRISLLTPYTGEINARMATHLESCGLVIGNVLGFDLDSDEAMTSVSPEDMRLAAIEACDPQADLLFISCTALRASIVIAEIERQLGKPVVASNQAMLWHALKLIGHPGPVTGFGRLFDTLDQ